MCEPRSIDHAMSIAIKVEGKLCPHTHRKPNLPPASAQKTTPLITPIKTTFYSSKVLSSPSQNRPTEIRRLTDQELQKMSEKRICYRPHAHRKPNVPLFQARKRHPSSHPSKPPSTHQKALVFHPITDPVKFEDSRIRSFKTRGKREFVIFVMTNRTLVTATRRRN